MGLTEQEIEALLTYIRRSKPFRGKRIPLKWRLMTSNQGSKEMPYVIQFEVWTADLNTNFELCKVAASGETNKKARTNLFAKAIYHIDLNVGRMANTQ